LAVKVAPFETPLLIEGEPGVGKATVAREVHRRSRRSDGPFVRVACGSLRDCEVEEKLFGSFGWDCRADDRRPTSFLEAAHRGTLYLDDVSRLPTWVQTRLIELLPQNDRHDSGQQGSILPDVRLVASTTCDLKAAVTENRFCPDLYYYLTPVKISVPPLRRRPEDIRALAEHFLVLAASVRGPPGNGLAWRFSESALECLLHCQWPDNATQLASAVAHAVMLADDAEIGQACVMESLGSARQRSDCETIAVPLTGGLKVMELAIVEEMIRRHRGNKAAAARSLELHRRTLYRILEGKGPLDDGDATRPTGRASTRTPPSPPVEPARSVTSLPASS
jgi:DNA-binding NtrC family response regulator